MEKIWTDLKAHFQAHSPQVLSALNPGVREAALVDFEKEFGIQLPEDYKASMIIHNGQPKTNYTHFLVTVDSYWLWPLEHVREECDWRVNVAQQPLELVSFARAGGSSKLYLNVSSDPDQYGKVNYYDELKENWSRNLTFTEFMGEQLERMTSGKTVPNEDGWYSLG